MLGIQNAKGKPQRTKAYRDLLKVAGKSVGYGEKVLEEIRAKVFVDPEEALMAMALAEELERFTDLSKQVIDQTERRVLHGEKVPASEKMVSLFEPHTDIIMKDRRETFYGHKVCLSSGHSNLITDCLITEGNPADSTLTIHMLDRHDKVFDRYPLKVALDGGFASKANLEAAKARGIKDVCFAKRRGLHVEDSAGVSMSTTASGDSVRVSSPGYPGSSAALALPSAPGRASGPSRAMSGRLLFPLTLLL